MASRIAPPPTDQAEHVAPEAGQGIPAGWFADPSGRFEQRYWSGTEWTEHVTKGGVPSSDPPPARQDAPEVDKAPDRPPAGGAAGSATPDPDSKAQDDSH